MIEYAKTWLALKSDKRTVTALEYGLIAAVIIAVCVGGFVSIGTSLSTKAASLATCVSTAGATC